MSVYRLGDFEGVVFDVIWYGRKLGHGQLVPISWNVNYFTTSRKYWSSLDILDEL